MTPERWQYIERLYYAALDRDTDEQAAFLAEACAGDEALRGEVESLLHCDARAENFIESPALEVAAQLQAEDQAAEIFDTLSVANIGRSTPGSGSSPAPPIFIGDYRVLRKLGEGGMGVVYEAEQRHPRRSVGLKVIRGGRLVDEYQVKLFQREVRALARLKHPGIAAIYEAGCADDGQHYFVMELVRGIPLLDYVKGRRLTGAQAPSDIRRRLDLFLKICEAISYAHQRGVIHRDLKPANILVTDESEGQGLGGSMMGRVEVKVLDFGLARIMDEDGAGASGLSQAGQVRGTLPYMSPEQVRGDPGEIDVRVDVYALGVILYELLTERLPYDLEQVTLPQAVRIICEDPPKPLSRAWGKSRECESRKTERLDRDVETIALKALEKEPERRYRSAAVMGEDVTRYLTNQPIHARPPSALYQFRKLVARHKAPFASLAAVFTLLLGFAITMAALSARIARERDKAVAAEQVAEQARNAEREQRDGAEQARNAEQEQRLLAEANLKRAEELRALAEQQRKRAEQEELSNRRLLYAAHMNLAAQAWEARDAGRTHELVEGHIPKPGEQDMRGFEWYYLWRLCHLDRLTLNGHEGAVSSLTFSPDGKRLASGSSDGTAKLWDAVSGKELATLKALGVAAHPVTFSPDGKRLATRNYGGALKLWDTANGQELTTLKGHAGSWIYSVAFSIDGKRLATGSGDRTVKLWDAATGRELATLRGHSDQVFSVAFSPDGKRLASGSGDHTVKLWDADTGQELATLKGHGARVSSVVFSPDGKRLASGSLDCAVKLWDAAASAAVSQEITTLKGHVSNIQSLTFSPDAKMLASGSDDRTVKLWDAATGRELNTLKGHGEEVLSVAFSPDGKRLASGSGDRTVKLWDVGADQEITTLKAHGDNVLSVAFSPDGKRLASGSYDRTVKLWNVGAGKELATLNGHRGNIFSVAFSPDGKKLASGSMDRTVKLWDVDAGKELATLNGHDAYVQTLTFSPDGRRLAFGRGDGTVKLLDTGAGQELATFKGHGAVVTSTQFSPDGKMLATGSRDRTVKLWDAATGRELNTLKGHREAVFSVAFSPDGKRLASASHDHTVKLWDVDAGQELATLKGHGAWVFSVAFSPDGKRLASGSSDRTVKLWDAFTYQELATLKGHGTVVFSVAFSPDGKRLASGSGDRTVRLWNAATENEVLARGKQ